MSSRTVNRERKPIAPESVITKAELLAAFVESLVETFQGLAAWQAFGRDTVAFLRERGMLEAFEQYRGEKAVATKAKRKR